MGIGIGGDYPLSSIISSEFSTTKWRGAIMAAVFSNQGLGQVFAGIVAMICVAGYKDDLIIANKGSECVGRCRKAADQMWRIIVGFGCVPGCIALYYRLTIAESPRYALDVDEHDDLEKLLTLKLPLMSMLKKLLHQRLLSKISVLISVNGDMVRSCWVLLVLGSCWMLPTMV